MPADAPQIIDNTSCEQIVIAARIIRAQKMVLKCFSRVYQNVSALITALKNVIKGITTTYNKLMEENTYAFTKTIAKKMIKLNANETAMQRINIENPSRIFFGNGIASSYRPLEITKKIALIDDIVATTPKCSGVKIRASTGIAIKFNTWDKADPENRTIELFPRPSITNEIMLFTAVFAKLFLLPDVNPNHYLT